MYIKESLKKVWIYTGKKILILNLLLLVLAAIFEQVYLVYFSELINRIIGAEFTFGVISSVVLFITINILLNFFTKISLNLCRINFIRNIKQKFFSSVFFSEEDRKDSFSDISTRNSENINNLNYLYDGVYSNVFRCFIRILFAFIVVSRINIFIALLAVIIPVLYNTIFILNGKNLNRMQGAEWRRNNRSNEFFDEINSSIVTVQGLKSQDNVIKRVDYLLNNVQNIKFLLSRFWARVSAGDSLLTQAFPIVLIGLMMIFSQNKKEIGSVYTVLYNIPIFLSFVWDFDINAFNRFYFSLSKIEEYFVFDEPKLLAQSNNHFETLEFSKVYVKRNGKIISNCNLSINKNDKVLIYGPSGSGKSTIINIFMGNIKDFEGTVKLNGNDLKSMKRSDIYSMIAYSSENNHFFTGTVYKNIRLINTKENFAKIIESKSFKFKLLDSKINESFSAGEKGILSFVNTFNSGKDLYVFDETCANLDVENLHKIIELIKNKNDKTIILVSHNPEIINNK